MATTNPADRAKKRAAGARRPREGWRTDLYKDIPADQPLTDLQEAFCQYYIVSLSGPKAAAEAGFSAKTARAKAGNLLSQPNIQRRIRELWEERKKRQIIPMQDRVIEELAAVAFAEMRQLANWDDTGVNLVPSGELEREVAAAVEEVRHRVTQYGVNVSVKLHSKLAALELLMRHLGMLEKQRGDDDQADQLAALVAAMNEAARAAAQ